jgi:hypothetical protein
MALQVFSHLVGVPVHYDRYDASSGYGYGTRGKPFKPRATPKMIAALQACFMEVFTQSPFGPGEVITSAGAFVDKPGHHGLGQAFDLDGIFWSSNFLVAKEYPAKPHLYLAVESVIRQHFGTVLNYNYNAAHQDHFHMDLGSPVGFHKMSKSRVEYLQASLFYVHGYQTAIDGVWGPSTEKVVRAAMNDLSINGGLSSVAAWLEYLRLTAPRGFQLANA